MAYPALAREITDEDFVISRLRAMEIQRLVVREGGQYRLLIKGLILTRALNLYQKILGRGMGG